MKNQQINKIKTDEKKVFIKLIKNITKDQNALKKKIEKNIKNN